MENKKLLEEIYRLMNDQSLIPNMEKKDSLLDWSYIFSKLSFVLSKDKEFKILEDK